MRYVGQRERQRFELLAKLQLGSQDPSRGLSGTNGVGLRRLGKVVRQRPLPVPGVGDRDALEQALLNLISNAMKYSIGMKEIAIRLYKNENHACIDVEDHGLGIQPDETQKIFESFYRSKDAHGRHIPGTGLGLSIVAHTMQAHNGGVTVNSVPGEGSTFTLYLPIVST